jgi:hypothetical protein
MAEVIALLQQRQRELSEQRGRLDQQAREITALTRELSALRGAPASGRQHRLLTLRCNSSR